MSRELRTKRVSSITISHRILSPTREELIGVDMSDVAAALKTSMAKVMLGAVIRGMNGGTPISRTPQVRSKQELLPRDGGPEPIERAIEHPFAVGDVVTHNLGGGVFRVVAINWAGDSIDVECLQAPQCEFAWCKVGDRESNLSRRYSLVRAAAP